MNLVKFTDRGQNTPIYINVSNITPFEKCHDQQGGTIIWFNGNSCSYITEHIAEVVAILTGKNALPAKILFGKGGEE